MNDAERVVREVADRGEPRAVREELAERLRVDADAGVVHQLGGVSRHRVIGCEPTAEFAEQKRFPAVQPP